MLQSFRARRFQVGVVGHLQTGRIRQVGAGGNWMGQSIDHWLVTENVKDPDGRNWLVDEEIMEVIGKSRLVTVFPAFDTAEQCSRIDRALFVRAARACHSTDGETATWRYNPDDEGNYQTELHPSLEPAVISKNGGSAQVKCAEESCPLVVDSLTTLSSNGRSTAWPCKPRGSFLFRVAASTHSGVYCYKTTSLPSTEAVYAMLAYLERVTHGNMAMVPLSLVMTQAKPRHGRTVNRVNLQIACTLPQMVEYALVWKRQKAELDVGLDADAAFDEADDDEADAAMFSSPDVGDTAPPAAPSSEEPKEEEAPAEPSEYATTGAESQERVDQTGEPPAVAPKPYHVDVGKAMQAAKHKGSWTPSELEAMLQVLKIGRVTEASGELCQIMLEALQQEDGPDWLRRYDETGRLALPQPDRGNSNGDGRAEEPSAGGEPAQPSPPYHDDDIPF